MMLDALNFDQLRVFVAIVDCGSFSAAARDLRRAQSAVSNAIANLEAALGVTLFDRKGWRPQLTAHGQALLPDARSVLARTDQLKARARGLTQGLETELSLVLDVMFPVEQLVILAAAFQRTFPTVVLRLCTEVLGGVPELVLAGEYDLGIQGSLPDIAEHFISYPLPAIALAPVSAPGHPAAGIRKIPQSVLRDYTQIVLTDRSRWSDGRSFAVFGEHRILTSDLGSKHAMLRAGLGWGFMPRSVVKEDLASARLIELDLAERSPRSRHVPLFLIHRRSDRLGPAAQWVVDALASRLRTAEL